MISAAKPPLLPTCSTGLHERSEPAHHLRASLVNIVATERETALAIQLYRAGSSAECNERLARLLYASDDKVGAEDLLRRMIDDPASDDEFMLASDFYARKFSGQRTGACTALLRAGSTITVDDAWRGNPEVGVAGVLRRTRAQGLLCREYALALFVWSAVLG
jgi:hypothetical protein